MDAVDEGEAERRGRVIVKLMERYRVESDPDKWLQAFTLKALRALARSNIALAEKGAARREIHAINREVASKAKESALSIQLNEDLRAVKSSM